MLSIKENYLRVLHGETPESVPYHTQSNVLAYNVTDEMIYENVRQSIDSWAPDGGFLWYVISSAAAVIPKSDVRTPLCKRPSSKSTGIITCETEESDNETKTHI